MRIVIFLSDDILHIMSTTTTTTSRARELVRRARCVMLEPSCATKAAMTADTHRWWFNRRDDDDDGGAAPPSTSGGGFAYDDPRADDVVDDPVRDDSSRVVDPSRTKRLGNGGTVQSRIAICHSLASIESWAMILAWDCIQRFGEARSMPEEFYDDFVNLAADEGRHFTLLSERLNAMGSSYGALETHDGLWRTARETATSCEARLVVEHCVHEARGLDVLPTTIDKFQRHGDEETARLLERVVYPEEITHCASGLRWFKYLYFRDGRGREEMKSEGGGGEETATSGVVTAFHDIVRTYFHGALKPPFNDDARARAGFTPAWYLPLAEKPFREETSTA